MRRLTFLLTCLFLIGLSLVNAQSKAISGKVLSSEDGQPVIGASVMVKGTNTGTITGTDGGFTIQASGSKVLVVSYVGMKTQELEAKPNMVVKLEPNAEQLDEVVVVAYGTTTKKSFTGSAAVIKGDKLSKSETSNISKALEGAVAGVQISSSTGQPGASADIRIRGVGSISAGQSPLIVVDGVPYEGSLNSISAQDIESMSVLKDAAANSLYGARGSNGVVLITTKQGQKGKPVVNFESKVGVNTRGVSAYDVITNPGDYYEMMWEANRNELVESGMSVYDAGNMASTNLITSNLGYNIYKGVADNAVVDPITGKLNSAASAKKWSDNWLTDPYKTGLRQEYNLSASAGSDNTNAYMSIGYINDQGYVSGSDFTRYNARVKVDQKVSSFMKAGMNIAYAQTITNAPISSTGGSNYSNIFNFTQNIAPIYPIYQYDLATGAQLYDSNGNKLYDFGSGEIANGASSLNTRAYAAQQNPIYKLLNDVDKTTSDNVSSRAYVELKFLKDFTFTANIAYDIFSDFSTSYTNPLQGDGVTYNGIGEKTAQRYAALNANQLLNYSTKFDKHAVEVLLGHETKSDDLWYMYGSKMNYYDPYNPEFSNAGSISGLTSYTSQYKLEGYFSRGTYNYADKYYLSASFRRDASSKFAPAVRWGNFWSVGGAWRMTEENFMKPIEAISNLRLKASYGTQGNDAISGSNLYLDQYTLTSDGTTASPTLTYRGAADLTWEKSHNFNAGFELGLFSRVNVSGEFYIKKTLDMIYQKPLPPSGGTPTWIWDNQIDMKNTGFEFEVNADVIKTNKVNWNVALNLSAYKNELTRVPEDKDPNGYQAGNYWRKVGGSLYDWYLYEYAGVDPTTGKSMWYTDDDNGNKVTTTEYSDAKLYAVGKSALPKMYGGLSTSVSAYGFDFALQTAFQLGGYVYDGVYAALMDGGTYGQNWSTDIFKRWTADNTSTTVPRVSTGDQNANATSTRFLTSASYFSLKNVSLGYTLPKKLVRSANINNLRVYLSADNVWLLSARKGLDPRQTFSGVTYSGTYSALRTTSLGLSVSF